MSTNGTQTEPERECDYGSCGRTDAHNIRRCKVDEKQYTYCDAHDPLEDYERSALWEKVGGGE